MTTMFARMGVPIDLGDRRFLHPGPLRWLRATAWMAGLFVLVALAGYLPLGLMERAVGKGGPGELLINIVAALLALAIYVLMVRLAEGRRASELAPRPALGGVLAGFAIGVLVFGTVMIVLIATGLYQIAWLGPAPAWTGGALSVQSGVIEEIMARAVILRLTWRAFGPWVAFIFSAGLFGALHLGNDNASAWAALCIAVEAGILLGAFYALTGRLWVSIGLHAGWNFTQGYLFGAAVSGTDFGGAIARSSAREGFPLWLTGGPFGPEASLPALVICSLAGFLTLGAAWKAGRFARRDASPAPATPA